jgi:hypothetical protein
MSIVIMASLNGGPRSRVVDPNGDDVSQSGIYLGAQFGSGPTPVPIINSISTCRDASRSTINRQARSVRRP